MITSSFHRSPCTKPGFCWARKRATNTNNPTRLYRPACLPATQTVTPSTGIGERYLGVGITRYAAAEFGYTHYATSTYKTSPSAIVNTVDSGKWY